MGTAEQVRAQGPPVTLRSRVGRLARPLHLDEALGSVYDLAPSLAELPHPAGTAVRRGCGGSCAPGATR